MKLGQRLKQARLDAGLSQRQLCGDEITRNMLSQIENGSARPSMATLFYLASRLGKPVSFFLEENEASPNQSLLTAARDAYSSGDCAAAMEALEGFQIPDPIGEAEYHLLTVLCCLKLAQAQPAHAREFLEKVTESGKNTPYYTPELERSRLLLLAQAAPAERPVIAACLPHDDRELLIRADVALRSGDCRRCAALLDAAYDQTGTSWLILRGDAAMTAGDLPFAVQCYQQAEASTPTEVYSRLEQCFLKLEDYKMAYHYACKQR